MKINQLFSFVILSLFLFSCSGDSEDELDMNATDSQNIEDGSMKGAPSDEKTSPTKQVKYAQSWEGKLGGKIPVFFHYTIKDSILSGELTYMNTKAKKPIRILGEIWPNNFYHILEYDKKAMITGIWSLTIKGDICTGKWYAPSQSGWYDPEKNKEFSVVASPSDSLVEEWDLRPDPNAVFGNYQYNYTKEHGNTGSFSFEKLTDYNANFEILGLASAPGFNMASIEETTVDFVGGKDTQFDFVLPESKECDFRVTFYNGFATVRYTKGNCNDGYFGHNATVEGLFLKVK